MKYDFSNFISYRLAQADLSIKRQMLATFAKEGVNISFEQWMILSVLYNQPGMIQSDLATITQKDKTNVTRMLDVLERNQYIERRPSEADRRSIQVSLSAQGEAIVSQLITPIAQLNRRLQGSLTDQEFVQFLEMLDRLGNDTDKEVIS